jgi:hypothetical protein
VCAGLYPNIVRVEEPAGAGKGAKPAKGPPKPPKLFTQSVKDPKPTPVSIHPCSVNFNRAKFPTRWLVRPPPPFSPPLCETRPRLHWYLCGLLQRCVYHPAWGERRACRVSCVRQQPLPTRGAFLRWR